MKLELHIPGLLAVPDRLTEQLQLPEADALQQWCRRAQTWEIAAGRFGSLAHLLGVKRVPLAALAWLGANGAAPDQQVFFATPVHFQAGMDDLVLFAGGGLHVSADELAAVIADAQSHFGNEPSLWLLDDTLFMQATPPLAVETTPLYRAQGRKVREQLPRGADAARLHAWMNELQMFLHGHDINRQRAAEGKPLLNGLWIWGEGGLPRSFEPRPGVTMHAHSLYMRGLCRFFSMRNAVLPEQPEFSDEGEHVFETDACIRALDADDHAAWHGAVAEISQSWLQPVLDLLRDNPQAQAVLYAGDGKARQLAGGRENRLARLLSKRAALQLVSEI